MLRSFQSFRALAIAVMVLWSGPAPAQTRDQFFEMFFQGMAQQLQQQQRPFQPPTPYEPQQTQPVEPRLTPVASTLPSCSDPAPIMTAFSLGLVNDNFGDSALADYMIITETFSLGVDNRHNMKTCRATFRCDIEKARKHDSFIRQGRHVMTETCFAINQAHEAGRPASTVFTIADDGDGSWVVRVVKQPNTF
jgi:hypothetical protein